MWGKNFQSVKAHLLNAQYLVRQHILILKEALLQKQQHQNVTPFFITNSIIHISCLVTVQDTGYSLHACQVTTKLMYLVPPQMFAIDLITDPLENT
jgi:hypothetical protein